MMLFMLFIVPLPFTIRRKIFNFMSVPLTTIHRRTLTSHTEAKARW